MKVGTGRRALLLKQWYGDRWRDINYAREAYVEAVEFLKAYRWQLAKEQPLVGPGRLRILLGRIWLAVHSLLAKDGYGDAEIEDALLFADPVTDLFGQVDLLIAEAASIAFNEEPKTSLILAENFGALVRAAGFSVDEVTEEADNA